MGKISEIIEAASISRPIFSFEFFPPKDAEGEKRLFSTIEKLKELNPDFVSVTYGAGGSTREKTLEWVTRIQNDYNITVMTHFTCVGASRSEVHASLDQYYRAGIRNIMALRGDPPRGESEFKVAADGFRYASELIAFIKSTGLDFDIGAAAYPEVHPEASTFQADMANLKIKVNSGVNFLVTQLFFDNRVYFKFVEECRKAGISVPIIPGVMPITQLKQIERFTKMAGTRIPSDIIQRLERHDKDQDALIAESIQVTLEQSRDLLRGGAPGIHFYTLNQSRVSHVIVKELRKEFG